MSKLLLSRDQTKPLIVNFNEAFGSMIERAPPINAACSNRNSKINFKINTNQLLVYLHLGSHASAN